MKIKENKILVHILVGVLFLALTFFYFLNKPHRNIELEAVDYHLKVESLYQEYNENQVKSNKKYGNKIIEIKGYIVEIYRRNNEVSFILNDKMEGVNCALDPIMIEQNIEFINGLEIGDNIVVKGKCDGFDMIMGVVLTRCFIINTN